MKKANKKTYAKPSLEKREKISLVVSGAASGFFGPKIPQVLLQEEE